MRDRRGVVLLGLAGLRAVLAVTAIPLAPVLYKDHFLALVLLRPTKEVLLVGGFMARDGKVAIPEMALTAVPLAIVGVWLFYFIGHRYADSRDRLPGMVTRLLPPEKVDRFCNVVQAKGTKVVFLGRLAVCPSTLVAVAAGGSGMGLRAFLVADGAGGVLSMAMVIGAGYLFGSAYESAGPWLAALGVVTLAAMGIVLGRQLRRTGSVPPQPAHQSGGP